MLRLYASILIVEKHEQISLLRPAPVKYEHICSISLLAISEENPLQWPQTQRKCERLLPEMDGGAGSEPD